MAVLSQTVRQQIWRGIMRYLSAQLEGLAVTKAELQAAVDAADTWADGAGSSYNSALPSAFRTSATADQKALLLAVVVLARFDTAALRRFMGEVD
jgi:hypothetical protein